MHTKYDIIYGQDCNAYEGTKYGNTRIEGYVKSSRALKYILKNATTESLIGGPHGYWPDDATTQMWTKFQARPINQFDNPKKLPYIHNASQLFYIDEKLSQKQVTEQMSKTSLNWQPANNKSMHHRIPYLNTKANIGLTPNRQYILIQQNPKDLIKNYCK